MGTCEEETSTKKKKGGREWQKMERKNLMINDAEPVS